MWVAMLFSLNSQSVNARKAFFTCVVHSKLKQFTLPAIGMKKSTAVKPCKQLKLAIPSLPTGVYWIDPDQGSSENAFQAYCDMETDGGGWNLVYSYTFTDYDHFMEDSNAVTPKPDWRNREGSVPISITPSFNESHYAAMSFNLWKFLGREMLIKSNINNWIACLPGEGSLGQLFVKSSST